MEGIGSASAVIQILDLVSKLVLYGADVRVAVKEHERLFTQVQHIERAITLISKRIKEDIETWKSEAGEGEIVPQELKELEIMLKVLIEAMGKLILYTKPVEGLDKVKRRLTYHFRKIK